MRPIKRPRKLRHYNQICVPKPYSLLLLLFHFAMFVSCVVCLLACESMLETLRTMFGLSVGGGVN